MKTVSVLRMCMTRSLSNRRAVLQCRRKNICPASAGRSVGKRMRGNCKPLRNITAQSRQRVKSSTPSTLPSLKSRLTRKSLASSKNNSKFSRRMLRRRMLTSTRRSLRSHRSSAKLPRSTNTCSTSIYHTGSLISRSSPSMFLRSATTQRTRSKT